MMLNLTPENLEALLDHIGIEVAGYTGQDFIAYCPFHLNRDSPALNVGKYSPYPWRCWNTSCAVSGTLPRLIEVAGDMKPMEALRLIYRYSNGGSNLDRLLARNEEAPYEPWPESRLDAVKLKGDWGANPAVRYMLDRGFTLDTINIFEIGYSQKKHRVVIPVRDKDGQLLGFSGRAIDPGQEPRYWDKGLPKKYCVYNLNRAKDYDDVVVVEGPLDAIKVAQAGAENVVAIFGGGLSNEQSALLTRNFRSCIIFTDNPAVDEAGAALLLKIGSAFKKAGKVAYIARYPEEHNVKDPGDMSSEQILQAIQDAESILKYKLRVLGGNRL